MNKRLISSGLASLILLWSCGNGHVHEHKTEHHEHDHLEHNHEHEHEHTHDHNDAHGHTHAHEAKHSDEIVISAEKAAIAGISAQTVIAGPFREIIHTSGEILPAAGDEASVVATTDGIISFTHKYTEGAAVSSDEEMFSIISGTLQDGNRIAKAKVAYETAKAEYERASKLTDSKIVSQKEFAVIKETYENARLAYEALKPSKNGKGVAVSAPFKGFIKNLSIKEGDFVTTGTQLATVAQNSHLVIEADLSHKYYGKRNEIVAANFRLSSSDNTFSTTSGGRLLSTGRSQNEGAYFVPVTFSIRNTSDMIPGSFAEIWLLCKEKENVITLPLSAITEEQGLHFVYLKLDDQCYKKQEVKLGASDGIRTEILSGIHEGDNVVTKGAYNVKLASASNAIPAHSHSH